MTSGIVLGDALRSNLLSLSNTNSLIDQTQLRLATGLDVNSALDDPQNFFAAASLNSRASDLSSLLDGIGQSIRTIEEADNGISSLNTLLETADSITSQASEALSAADAAASTTGNAANSLTGVTDLTTLAGIDAGDSFTVQVGSGAAETVTIDQGNGINGLLANLNDIANVDASLDSSGQLSIATTNGESLTIANAINLETGVASTGLTETTGLGFTNVDTSASNAQVGTLVGTGLAGGDDVSAIAAAGDSFDITVTDNNGISTTSTVTIGAGQTVQELADTIGAVDGVEAGVTGTGQFFIQSTDGSTFTTADNNNTPLADLGITPGTTAPEEAGTTFLAGDTLSVDLINEASGDIAARTDTFADLLGFDEGAGGFEATSFVDITVDGGTTVSVDLNQSISSFVDEINDNANGNVSSDLAGLSASFDDATGSLSITADSTVVDFTLDTASIAADEQTAFAFGNGSIDALGGTAGPVEFATSNGDADSTLAQLANDFNEVLSQIDNLVNDSSFAGVNLLTGDDLVTTFNEDASSQLTTEGVDFTSGGLGLQEATFTDLATVSQAASQIDDAVASVEGFGTTIANDLTIVQVREDFTQETINTLVSGAEDLTVADQTEEGANLLALQTRQSLGVTALSLAAASQQSVLSLF